MVICQSGGYGIERLEAESAADEIPSTATINLVSDPEHYMSGMSQFDI